MLTCSAKKKTTVTSSRTKANNVKVKTPHQLHGAPEVTVAEVIVSQEGPTELGAEDGAIRTATVDRSASLKKDRRVSFSDIVAQPPPAPVSDQPSSKKLSRTSSLALPPPMCCSIAEPQLGNVDKNKSRQVARGQSKEERRGRKRDEVEQSSKRLIPHEKDVFVPKVGMKNGHSLGAEGDGQSKQRLRETMKLKSEQDERDEKERAVRKEKEARDAREAAATRVVEKQRKLAHDRSQQVSGLLMHELFLVLNIC